MTIALGADRLVLRPGRAQVAVLGVLLTVGMLCVVRPTLRRVFLDQL